MIENYNLERRAMIQRWRDSLWLQQIQLNDLLVSYLYIVRLDPFQLRGCYLFLNRAELRGHWDGIISLQVYEELDPSQPTPIRERNKWTSRQTCHQQSIQGHVSELYIP
jgi:hypothetical protein